MSELVVSGVTYSHVHVIVDGTRGTHSFTNVAITRRLNTLGSTFSIEFPNRWVSTQNDLPLIAGRRVRVFLKERNVMLDGFIEQISAEVDDGNHIIKIAGRDKTGDLIDCSVIPERRADGSEVLNFPEFNNLTLAEIARKVCDPFKITVYDQARDMHRFQVAKFRPGETVFNFLNRLSKQRGLLLNSVARAGGGLAIAKVGQITYAKERLDFSNILACSTSVDTSKIFSRYTVLSQTSAVVNIEGDEGEIDQETNVVASVRDASARRKTADGFVERHLVLPSEKQATPEQALSRARWEHVKRLGESLRIKIMVNGWLTRDGDIWRENRKVKVVYPHAGLDGIYLITSCRYVYGADESIKTQLELTHKDAYQQRVGIEANVEGNTKWNLDKQSFLELEKRSGGAPGTLVEQQGEVPTNDGGINAGG